MLNQPKYDSCTDVDGGRGLWGARGKGLPNFDILGFQFLENWENFPNILFCVNLECARSKTIYSKTTFK